MGLTFSTTCGKAFLGIGSALLRFLTLGNCLLSENLQNMCQYLDVSTEGAAAASAAALASPCNASIGAFKLERGRVSSDSSSVEGAVLGMMPYEAYLCG